MSTHGKTFQLRWTPLEHVFVGTDFSPGAAQALARASRLPLATSGRISVVHVLPDHLPQKTRATVEKEASGQLEQAVGVVRGLTVSSGRSDIELSSELCRGRSYVEIIRHARSVGSQLIILGRHGRRDFRDMFIGSTASRVVRMGDIPVLVVSRKATRSYDRPVIAVDLKDTSRSVVEAALRIMGSDIKAATLMHAYRIPFEGIMATSVSRTQMAALRKEYKQDAAAKMSRFQASLGVACRWRTRIVQGDARVAIIMETIMRHADLVAVGTHGRSGLSHSLVGSVAESVIEASSCDVLVARPARVSFELP